ncbi:GDSL family lipase [Spirosoma sp. BT702]|uniref:GDSL family lipase n=1 Tax=Spirosoma profusum TaxID=2771354 RepID=A0A926XWJ1_9BACT|nr:GDSL-type esterase/lipase family protein [Spirosoma profusum]MBD2702068.1 GDSL family lipase [Spirosoma profusum]
MRKPILPGLLIHLLLCFSSQFVRGQNVAEPFNFQSGDRVVFLGNSLFENDMQFGYLELALTTRWPDRDVTYRNLGWSGDDVFGDGRSDITTPPTPYEALINEIAKAKPTVVFIAYGGIEAQEGESGLPRFQQGLNQLINKIDSLGAKTILLSPIPILSGQSADKLTQRNAELEQYASAISKLASDRKKRYIDLFKPVQEVSKKAMITDNGIHLNETGYYYLATILEKGLGLNSRFGEINIDVTKSADAIAPAKMINFDKSTGNLSFKVDDTYLPLVAPQQDGKIIDVNNGRLIKISGLKKGFYTLTIDNDDVKTASAKEWADGVVIRQGPAFTQSAELRQMILKKNEQFFFQYRPLNRTYIIGFRSYEQGRHKKGLEEQSLIIKWLEGQIAVSRQPKSATYQLTQLK